MRLIDFAKETDKFFAHQYIEVYEGLFEPIRDRVLNVLEVGINTGNSHRMWRDYFHNANVYGIDIYDFCGGMKDEDRIDVRFMDAYSEAAIDSFGSLKFDVLVDDGPHTLSSQLFFVQNYCRLMADNGILVVEDIPHADWIPALSEAVPDNLKNCSFGIDRRWVPGRNSINDELMFVIDRRFVGGR
jgi:hypothetical protein